MPPSSLPTQRKPRIDVRQLSLVQLQALAKRGSQRARQELQARMAALPPPPPMPRPGTQDPRNRPPPFMARQDPPPAPAPPPPRAWASPPPPMPGAFAAMDRAPAGVAEDPRIRQLEYLGQQDEQDAQARGLPQLIGLIQLGWGGLLAFAGLVTALSHRGGSGYYLVMGAAILVVGWLLLKSRFLAVHAQAALVLIALVWGWSASRSFAGMLAQAAPIWIPGSWIAVPHVRELLD